MKNLISEDETGIFADGSGSLRIDSRTVAQLFGKQHFHVLRDIYSITSTNSGYSTDFVKSNFGFNNYEDSYGRKNIYCLMTFQGFLALTMGYVGAEANRRKEEIIAGFSRMSDRVNALLLERSNFREYTDAIQDMYPEDKYIYAYENAMINEIITGMLPCDYKSLHGMSQKDSTRPTYQADINRAIHKLQAVDIGLLTARTPPMRRRELLIKYAHDHNLINLLPKGE